MGCPGFRRVAFLDSRDASEDRGATVARSAFERLEASGFRELTVHLTEEARARGLAAAAPARFTASVGYGRGERTRFEVIRRVTVREDRLREGSASQDVRHSRIVDRSGNATED
jgi:hypothetical protein